jgi:signal transduction histidine kinase
MRWEFDSSSVAEATASRRQFVSILRRLGDDASDFDAAELIFGELIGNVVRHAPGTVRVVLAWNARYAVLIVHDRWKPFVPAFALPADAFAETGRGLFLVKMLARSVRVVDVPGNGTTVTVELPVARRA